MRSLAGSSVAPEFIKTSGADQRSRTFLSSLPPCTVPFDHLPREPGVGDGGATVKSVTEKQEEHHGGEETLVVGDPPFPGPGFILEARKQLIFARHR